MTPAALIARPPRPSCSNGPSKKTISILRLGRGQHSTAPAPQSHVQAPSLQEAQARSVCWGGELLTIEERYVAKHRQDEGTPIHDFEPNMALPFPSASLRAPFKESKLHRTLPSSFIMGIGY